MFFADLRLPDWLLRAVPPQGYNTATPIQAQAIPHVLLGRDLEGCAQTGTGKTAAFALPILHRLMEADAAEPRRDSASHLGETPRRAVRRIRVLVLSPTRELAAQIGDSFVAYGRHTAI